MQTDCPTNVMRRNVMRGKQHSETEAERNESGMKKIKLPHTRDPEFAKPAGQDKKEKQSKDKDRKRRGERR